MALDKVLKIYDEQGNPVDYDILASDVKLSPDGKDLPTKLAEMQDDIDHAGQGDGTVTGVKVGNTPYNPDSDGVVDLSAPFAGKVDKETGKSLMTDAERTKLQNLPTADQLTQQLDQKVNDNAVVKSISVNGTAQTKDGNGNVNINVQGGLTKEDISVETQGDGTVDINVKDDTYKINLNHTHENMAKLVVCEESDLPSTLDKDTIYAQVDDAETPTEIQSLWIAGLEFVGGGAAPGLPYLSSPGANISMGDVENGSVTKAIRVKGRYLTQALSATLTGTGYAFDTTQPTGVTRNSDTSLTITADAAKAGVDVSVVYTGTAFNATGALAITSSSPDNIDVESTLVANVLDTDGLIGHWDASDAPSSGAWVDRINSMKLNLGGTAAHDSGGYRLNNLSAPKNAWLYLDPSETTKMNTEIDKEFVCIVDCEVKFSAESKKAMLIDFGSFGTPLSGLALSASVNQTGTLACTAKKGDSTITAQANNVQIPAFPLDTYVPIRVKCGICIASNGTQIIQATIGTARAYSWNSPAITINFQGCSGPDNPNYAFGAGVLYMSGSSVNAFAGSYLADVVYKSIIIYNKYV